MKQKIGLKRRKEQLKANKKFNNVGSDGKNKKISLQQFLPLSEVEIQGFIHPSQRQSWIISRVVSFSPGTLDTF
jgi:hypothetical protein